jgi:hypothetical protein
LVASVEVEEVAGHNGKLSAAPRANRRVLLLLGDRFRLEVVSHDEQLLPFAGAVSC